MPNYDVWLTYLQLNAWVIPNGLQECGVVRPLTPVMYGHLPLTLLAIDLLFCFFSTRRSGSILDKSYAMFDQARLSVVITECQIKGYSNYDIACALTHAARRWDPFDKYLYRLFRTDIKEAFVDDSIFAFDAGRSDATLSGQFRNLKGCIPESKFSHLSQLSDPSSFIGMQTDSAAKAGEADHGGPVNNNNNNNNNNNSNNNNSNDSSMDGPSYADQIDKEYGFFPKSNRPTYGSPEYRNYWHNHFDNIYSNNHNNNNNNNSNSQTIYRVSNPDNSDDYSNLKKHSSGSVIIVEGARQKSPSGRLYPRRLEYPKLFKSFRLYAPRLRYFKHAFNLYDNPKNDPLSYLVQIGDIPVNYCRQYNAGVYCDYVRCVYHHLCEWCAGEHAGNACPYRPPHFTLRLPNEDPEANYKGSRQKR